MIKKEMIAMLLAGGQGSRLGVLTSKVAKPAVAFGGKYRIDENGVMNKSILDYGGSILSISQFTLYADTKKGNRPSYINALSGEYSSKLYDEFNKVLSESIHVETGIFGADMEVDITNIGPTTIMLER